MSHVPGLLHRRVSILQAQRHGTSSPAVRPTTRLDGIRRTRWCPPSNPTNYRQSHAHPRYTCWSSETDIAENRRTLQRHFFFRAKEASL